MFALRPLGNGGQNIIRNRKYCSPNLAHQLSSLILNNHCTASLYPGHHRPRQIHDRVPVRLDRLCGVDDEGEGRVDDDIGGREGRGAHLAVAVVDASVADAAVAIP